MSAACGLDGRRHGESMPWVSKALLRRMTPGPAFCLASGGWKRCEHAGRPMIPASKATLLTA